MKKRKLLGVLLAACMMAALIGCSAPKTDGDTKTDEKKTDEGESKEADSNAFIPDKPQIKAPAEGVEVIDILAATKEKDEYPQYDYTFALHNYAPDFQSSIDIADGVRKEAEKYGIKIVEADCNMDVNKIPQNIQNFLLQDVDGIIDASWLGGDTSVDMALDEGVPTVAFDTIDKKGYSWGVGGDNATSGIAIGEYMAGVVKEKWGGSVDYLCITWPQAVGESMETRMSSAIEGLKNGGVELSEDQIFWFDTGGQAVKAKNTAADFLTAHPDSHKILFGGNNGDAGVGILAAIQASGREDDCMLYTYGAEQAAIDNFKGEPNCWVADVGYYFKQYGALGVQTMIRILNGEEVNEFVTPEMFIVNYDTINEYKGY